MKFEDRPFIRCSHCFTEFTFQQFLKLVSYWIDPKKKKMYGKGTVCQCGMQFHQQTWMILSKVDNYFVSTVDLEIPHGGVDTVDWFDYGFWYETMYWQSQAGQKDVWGEMQYRYKTKAEAIKGQEFVVKNLNKIILNPERFPQNTISMFCNAIGAAQASEKIYSEETKYKAQ